MTKFLKVKNYLVVLDLRFKNAESTIINHSIRI